MKTTAVKNAWILAAVAGTIGLTITLAAVAGTESRPLVNSLGMRLIRIEPGPFQMGQQTGGDYDERPVHKVTISKPFYMAATEVTNAQYEQFDPSHRKYRGFRGVSNEDDEAVTFVSWQDATAFSKWLSEKEGRPYRLPTEAEWECACRAGTTTPFSTGPKLPAAFHKNQPVEGDWNTERTKKDRDLRAKKGQVPVSLKVGAAPANPWGLLDMHGNVEEWCYDWYGAYPALAQMDPVGPAKGLFKVSRGGSHNTYVRHLRSANRHSALPGDKHWIIGFRLVQGELPATPPLPAEPSIMDGVTVNSQRVHWPKPTDRPVFLKPVPFVRPDTSNPWLADLTHHHCPSITWCDNGDLLAVWFNTRSEIGREMVVLSSRLRKGENEWDTARLFFDAADRNDTGSNVFNDGRGRLFFFNGVSESSHHKDQCLVMSTSTDSGHTWTLPRIISSLDERRKYTPMDSAFVAHDGSIVLAVDTNEVAGERNETGGTVFISRDHGATWREQTTDTRPPHVVAGRTGTLTAGLHLSVVELEDGRLLSFSRTGDIGNRMTKNLSSDMGRTWRYSASQFPGLGGGQRLVLMRLREGPILLVSFTDKKRKQGMLFPSAGGKEYIGYGMFAALSFDEGEAWPVKQLLTAGGPRREMDGGGNTHEFLMDDTHAEPAGYLAATQTPDGIIHLISSRLHYRFNLAWLKKVPTFPER